MVEELKKAPETTPPPAKKGGMMKMLIVGGALLVLTGIVSVGTVFIIGTDEPATSADSTAKDSLSTIANTGSHAEEIPMVQKTNKVDELKQLNEQTLK